MKDKKEIERGQCRVCECSEYECPIDGHQCCYCNHLPPDHQSLLKLDSNVHAQGTSDVNSVCIPNFTNEVYQSNNSAFPVNVTNDLPKNYCSPSSLNNDDVNNNNHETSGTTEFQMQMAHHSAALEDSRQMSTVHSFAMEFTLPEFGEFCQPYLEGTAHPGNVKMLRSQFIDELCHYLDSNKLLTSKNSVQQAWGYKKLQFAILKKYPNIIKDREQPVSVQNGKRVRSSGMLGLTISRLAERRRKRNKRVLTLISSPEAALAALQDNEILSTLSKHDKLIALRLSKSIRQSIGEGLPYYLQTADMLKFEVELFLGKTLKQAELLVKKLLGKLRGQAIYTMDDLISYLTDQPPYFLEKAVSLTNTPAQVGPCIKMENTAVTSSAVIYVTETCHIFVNDESPIKLHYWLGVILHTRFNLSIEF